MQAAYFGDMKASGGLKHEAGYSNYLDSVKQSGYLKHAEYVLDKVSGKILELGCGIGVYAKEGISRGLDWTAVDILTWCKEHEVTSIIKSDALAYLQTQDDNSFNWIVSFAFLECIPNPDLLQLYNEMKRVASTGQIHSTYKSPNSTYYESRTIAEWKQDLSDSNVEVRYVVG